MAIDLGKVKGSVAVGMLSLTHVDPPSLKQKFHSLRVTFGRCAVESSAFILQSTCVDAYLIMLQQQSNHSCMTFARREVKSSVAVFSSSSVDLYAGSPQKNSNNLRATPRRGSVQSSSRSRVEAC